MAEYIATEPSMANPMENYQSAYSNYRTLNTEASSGDMHLSSTYFLSPQNRKLKNTPATNLHPSSIQSMLGKDPVVYRFELEKEGRTKADKNRRFKPSNIKFTKEINDYEETYNTV